MNHFYLLVSGLFILGLIACSACSSSKKRGDTSHTKESTTMAGHSASTKQFIKDLQQELESTPRGETFRPSENMIKKYRLKKEDDTYYVGTMIRTDEGFDTQVLENNGVRISTKAGNIITARVPVTLVIQLLHQYGINYLQIDEPVRLR